MSAADRSAVPPPPDPPSGPEPAGASDIGIGSIVGRYQVQRMLGKGAMGVVFEAVDTTLRREVALKVLSRDIADRPRISDRFVREAQLAARLNHPNAVTVFDCGRDGEVLYIAMELVRGQSVHDRINREGPFEFAEATRIVIESCRALAAAHFAGLIHRDIKPSNILYSDQGIVKVADFGLAKSIEVGEGHPDESLTAEGRIVGTPKYISPEQARHRPVDPRADLYSLGATYFTLLTGRAPFNTGTAVEIMYAHCHAPPPDPRELDASLPPACSDLIRKAMAKSPDERYQTADEMRADLEKVPAESPSVVGAASPFVAEAGARQSTVQLPPLSTRDIVSAVPERGDRVVRIAAVVAAAGIVVAVTLRLLGFGAGGSGEPAGTDAGKAGSPPAVGRGPPVNDGAAQRIPPDGGSFDKGPPDRDGPRKSPPPDRDFGKRPFGDDGPDFAEFRNDPAFKHLAGMQGEIARAAAEKDRGAVERVAVELLGFHYHFRGSPPESPHLKAAMEAKDTAERYLPGIYQRTPPERAPFVKPMKRPPPPP
jgi:predicted Ser/Thr protein kinase